MVRIAYIAGCGRSGTTLLARLLGEIPGFVAVGEAGWYFLGLRDASAVGIPCGCGAAISECSLWGKVSVDPQARMLARELIRGHSLHRTLWGRPETHPGLQRFLAAASGFYHTLAARTGAAVIVDSSKSSLFAALLARSPGIRVHVIHMIRDLRGVVSSGRRPKAYAPVMSPPRSILHWYRANVGAELLERRTAEFSRFRYEDFVAYPRPLLEQLASAIRGFPVHCPFLYEGQVQVHAQHLVTGNPDKFQCGQTWLRERQPELGPVLNHFVSLMGAPLLARYGYFSRKRNGAPALPSEVHGEEALLPGSHERKTGMDEGLRFHALRNTSK